MERKGCAVGMGRRVLGIRMVHGWQYQSIPPKGERGTGARVDLGEDENHNGNGGMNQEVMEAARGHQLLLHVGVWFGALGERTHWRRSLRLFGPLPNTQTEDRHTWCGASWKLSPITSTNNKKSIHLQRA